MKTKVCSKCKIELPITEFYKRSDSNRLRSHCKYCYSTYFKNNKNHIQANKREWTHKTGIHQPLEVATDCGSYLGIYITERVVSHYFDNVTRTPMGTPGHDLICNKGYKIEVKSACISNKNTPGWTFHIRRNIIADYFVCLAFNNRINLSPMHIWIIPKSIASGRSSITITNSKKVLKKWEQYEKPLDKVIACCNSLRG
jgi:hypothetical protein